MCKIHITPYTYILTYIKWDKNVITLTNFYRFNIFSFLLFIWSLLSACIHLNTVHTYSHLLTRTYIYIPCITFTQPIFWDNFDAIRPMELVFCTSHSFIVGIFLPFIAFVWSAVLFSLSCTLMPLTVT